MGRILTDEPAGQRDALRPLANGKLVALGKFALPLLIAAVVAYFTAQAETKVAVAVVTERENNHFAQLKSELGDVKDELRLLRAELLRRER
jgi:hypothetical protein